MINSLERMSEKRAHFEVGIVEEVPPSIHKPLL